MESFRSIQAENRSTGPEDTSASPVDEAESAFMLSSYAGSPGDGILRAVVAGWAMHLDRTTGLHAEARVLSPGEPIVTQVSGLLLDLQAEPDSRGRARHMRIWLSPELLTAIAAVRR